MRQTGLLEVRLIEAFLAVTSTGSMTRAAALLGCSQPAVTRLVQELEGAVGFALFARNGPRITPTEKGLLFFEEAQRLMAGLRQIGERADAIREGREAVLNIAATPSMGAGLVGVTLAAMDQARLPRVLTQQSNGAEQVVRSVTAHVADLGIASFPLDHAALDLQVVCESPCVAVVAQDDELATQTILDLSALAHRRFVTVGNLYRLRSAINETLGRLDIHPPSEMSTNSSLNAIMAARAGLGVAIVDPVSAYGVPVSGVRILPLSERISYHWGLFTAKGKTLTPLMQDFIRAFGEACRLTIPGVASRAPEQDDERAAPPRSDAPFARHGS